LIAQSWESKYHYEASLTYRYGRPTRKTLFINLPVPISLTGRKQEQE
jgi:hypothetical protein